MLMVLTAASPIKVN